MERWDAEPLYLIFDPPATVTTPEPEPVASEPPTRWDIEKRMNRLAKKLGQIDAGRLVPRLQYRWTGEAEKEVQEVRTILAEVGQAIQEGKHGD